ncbi:hypothetical protein BC567DRAFT_45737 [Phyllosticta citribraziliensis]
MSFSKPALLATAILATGALAKTDLSGCTSSNTVAYGGASVIWYVPGTGEICEALDCGGGRAPPKTTVPGCAAYSGTASYSPSYLPGYGPGATSAPVAAIVEASSTGIAPGYAAPPAASSSGVAAIVVAPSASQLAPVITPAPIVVPSAGAPAVSASGVPVPVPAVKPGMSMSMPHHPASPSSSPIAADDDEDDYCSSSDSDSEGEDSSDSDTDDDDCAGSDVAAIVSSTLKVVPSAAGASIYAPAPVSATSLKAGLVATPTPARSTPLQFTGAAAGIVGVKGAMVALAGVAVAGLALL